MEESQSLNNDFFLAAPAKKPKLDDNKKKKAGKKEQDFKLFRQKKSKKVDSDDDDNTTQGVQQKCEESQSEMEQKKTNKAKEQKKAAKEKGKKENKKEAKEQKGSRGAKKQAAQPKGKQPLIREDAESLLQYMKEMNRPFTLNYLKDSLHLKAAQLAKNLDTLLKNEDIVQKEVGASKIFLYNQSLLPEVDKEEMEKLAFQLGEQSEELKLLNAENKKLDEQLRQILKIPKISELEAQIKDYEAQIAQIDHKMSIYQSSQFQKAPENEVIAVEQEVKRIEDACLKRKKMYMNAIDTLLEGSEMTVKEFELLVGISRD